MGVKIRAGLLICLVLAAALTGFKAARSLRRTQDSPVPEEVYARFVNREEPAQYYLGESNGFVAVFKRLRDRSPLRVTSIELGCLRAADRALLQKGIPVASEPELLGLLEDLGS